ncbi:MAG TPA: DNA translocase FtsK, partial [Gaiellaceae bacterium]
MKRRTRKGGGRAKSEQHLELIGLGLLAVGLFLASILYLGWSGGMVGGGVADGFTALLGAAAYVAPLTLLIVGGLMVSRSELVDVRPFRTGLLVTGFGLLAALGSANGGLVGDGLQRLFGLLVGATGTTIIGVLALVVGGLLLSGASAGALVRRSGHAVKRAHSRARKAVPLEHVEPAPVIPLRPAHEPPVDAVHDFPDVVGENEPPRLLVEPLPADDPDQTSLFDAAPAESREEYHLPDRGLLRRSPAASAVSGDVAERTAAALVQTLAHFGVQATIVGQISGPRVTRYELQLAPGTKVSKVAALKDDLSYALATTEIRILAPIPGKQAVGVEVPNLSPNLVTLGDIFDDLPATASPLAVWLGKDISGTAVWTDLARMPHLLIAGTTGSGKS